MNKYESKSIKTLERVVARAVLFGVVITLVLLLMIESVVFIFPTLRFYKREVKHDGDIAVALLGKEYILDYFSKAKDIYYSTPEEIRHDQFSEDYVSLLRPIIDDEYREKRNLLSLCREQAGLEDICFVFYDEETDRLVFVLDGNDKSKAFLPGQWVSNEIGTVEDLKAINTTMRSDWVMPIAYGKVTGWVGSDYRGFYDDAGNLVGYISVNVEVNSIFNQMRTFLAIFSPLMALLTVWIARRAEKWIKKRMLDPIAGLTEKAREYTSTTEFSGDKEHGAIFKSLPLNTGDEIEELWKTMVEMEDDVALAMQREREEAAQKERIATELDLARNIQLGVLPVDFEEFARDRGFEIFASMHPAKEVGGDFYDYFTIDEKHVGLVITDVSGKGIPAALFMMISKALIKGRASQGGKPSEILAFTNNSLCEDNPFSMFITVWFGILNTETGEVVAANAGHEYPFVTGEDGRLHKMDDPHGVVVGCIEDMEYEDYTFTIPKGGMLFVYTDGAPESQNEKEEMFGMDRLEEAVNWCRDMGPKKMVEYMKVELDNFKGNAEQFDDITMLAVKIGE